MKFRLLKIWNVHIMHNDVVLFEIGNASGVLLIKFHIRFININK
jgi:hypothetical protein